MGLGKTVQAIAAMATWPPVAPAHFLVVCPASVLINWAREIARHTPTLGRTACTAAGRDAAAADWLREGGVGVTTFGSLGALPADVRRPGARCSSSTRRTT